jgi:hypothetical protein
VKFLWRRADRRALVTSLGFHAGAVLVGWLVWRAAMPPGWTLSFWTTLQASVDSQTYGHPIEHAAEVLASKAIILGACGGLLTASLMWLASAETKRP